MGGGLQQGARDGDAPLRRITRRGQHQRQIGFQPEQQRARLRLNISLKSRASRQQLFSAHGCPWRTRLGSIVMQSLECSVLSADTFAWRALRRPKVKFTSVRCSRSPFPPTGDGVT